LESQVGVIDLKRVGVLGFSNQSAASGNTKGGSITVPLTSCLTSLDHRIERTLWFGLVCFINKNKKC
jgi:hypothetical protein